MIGKQVRYYRIAEELRGMGFVYKAESTKLQRIAGLNLLPEEMATVQQALGRFQR